MREPAALAPDIRAYLDAENAYTEAAMADVAGLKDAARRRDAGAHQGGRFLRAGADGPFAYGIRFAHGAEHPMLVRADRDGRNETVLLDANALRRRQGVFPSRRQRP